jgi:hypothetical protein
MCFTALSSLGGVFSQLPTTRLGSSLQPLGWNTDSANSATHLYSRGTWLGLLLRHSRNTSRDFHRARVRHIVCVILVTRHVMFTVTLPRARLPYCLRRHTLLLHGCLATVVNKRHIAYSMHFTILCCSRASQHCTFYFPTFIDDKIAEAQTYEVDAISVSRNLGS